jgi:hypothetical protein
MQYLGKKKKRHVVMLWPLLLTYVGAARHGAGHRNPGVQVPQGDCGILLSA